jgi:hypothetical protein
VASKESTKGLGDKREKILLQKHKIPNIDTIPRPRPPKRGLSA